MEKTRNKTCSITKSLQQHCEAVTKAVYLMRLVKYLKMGLKPKQWLLDECCNELQSQCD